MTPSPDHHEKLERLIHRALCELPLRHAPDTLAARVLAELERRAALPWWRQNYAHWPLVARAAFFLGTAALAALLVAGLFSLTRAGGPAQLAGGFAWLTQMRDLAWTAFDTAAALWRSIPPLWLYGALAALAACYATLVGVGAAAYRTFRAAR